MRDTPSARPPRRRYLDFDVLEARVPVSEGVGPLLTVSALNTAALLAQPAAAAPAQPYQVVDAAGARALAEAASQAPNPMPYAQVVSAAAPERPAAPQPETASSGPWAPFATGDEALFAALGAGSFGSQDTGGPQPPSGAALLDAGGGVPAAATAGDVGAGGASGGVTSPATSESNTGPGAAAPVSASLDPAVAGALGGISQPTTGGISQPTTGTAPAIQNRFRPIPGGGGTGPSSSTSSSSSTLWVLDANKAIVVTPGIVHHDFATWAVDLRAQVRDATVASYSWDLSSAPDATSVSGSSYRLQFTWASFTGAARTDTITLTVTDTSSNQQTQTLTFRVASTTSPAWASSSPTSASTWPSVLPPDASTAGQDLITRQYYSLGLNTGEVLTGHTLPAYNPGVPALGLVYSSLAADPRPVFIAHYPLDPSQAVPATVSARLTLNGTAGSTFYYDTSPLNPGDILQIALQGDATGLSTGRYSYSIAVTANYGTPVTTTYSGSVDVVNEASSPFGSGWTLANVQRLWPVTGGALLEMAGGLSLWFAAGSDGSFTSPAGDFSTLVRNGDGTYTRTYKDGNKVNFDSSGRQSSQVDRNGNTVTFAYDSSHRLTNVSDFNSLTTTLAYDSSNRVSSLTDPANRVTTLAYNTSSQLTGITDPDSAQYGFSYDSANRLTQLTDARSHTTTIVYDFAGRAGTITRPDSSTEQLTPLELGGLVQSGSGTSGSPAPAVLAVEAQTAYTDPDSSLWQTRLDWLGFGTATQPVDPLGDQAETYRDGNGLAWLASDALGRRSRSFFDSKGNPTEIVRPDDSYSQYQYNSFSEPTQVINPRGVTTGYTYDSAGNLTEYTDGLSHVTTMTYTSRGFLATVTDPLNHTVTYGYDTRSRLMTQTDALNHTATLAYDSASDVTSLTDARGETTTLTYDAMGRGLTQLLPDNNSSNHPTITLTYDAAVNVRTVTDPTGNTTTYTYDALNRTATAVDPLNHTSTYGYSAAGDLTSVIDRDGRQTSFTYDAAHRRTTEDWLNSSGNSIRTFTYTYDAAGQLTGASDPDSVYAYSYDSLGRLINVDNYGTPGVPHVSLTYTYDAADNRTGLSDNLGGTVGYTYDAADRLTALGLTNSSGVGPLVTFSYDAANRLTQATYNPSPGTFRPPKIQADFSYDAANRTTGITYSLPNSFPPGQVLASYTYGYDNAGLVTSYSGPEGALTYTYDAVGQLTGVSGAHSESYSYDLNGNRTMTGYTTGTGNRLTSDGTYNYTYDNEGNVLTQTRISDGQETDYTWDYRNRLTDVKVKNSSGMVIKEDQFTYDVGNLRIGKSLDPDGSGPQPAVQTWTVYDGANPYADFNTSGSLTARYLYGLGADALFARLDASGSTVWYLTDLLGSVRQLANSSGSVIDQLGYDSYGNILSESLPANGDRFKWTGRDLDSEIGLQYNRARCYRASIGRFMSADPTGFRGGDTNLYRYVINSSPNLADPSGLWSWPGAAGGFITGFSVGTLIGGPLGGVIGGFVGLVTGGNDAREEVGGSPNAGDQFAAGLVLGFWGGVQAGLIGLGGPSGPRGPRGPRGGGAGGPSRGAGPGGYTPPPPAGSIPWPSGWPKPNW
jgi:RHS repeat-associated protein